MTFHKHAIACLVLLLTLVILMLASAPAEARAHRTGHHGKRSLHLKKKASGHHARGRHHRSRRTRNRIRHAGRYLAAARRLSLKTGDVQTGTASWYGARYHGRSTSSGEIFDKDALTAAHLSLPFGTRVRIKNLLNDSSVIVRITDRGPFGRGRIVDVSEAAARELGILAQGVCRVAMEVLPEALPAPCFDADELPQFTPIALDLHQDHYYFLEAGTYRELARAEAALRQVLAQDPELSAIVSDETVNGQVVHRVLAGRFNDRLEAVLTSNRLRAAGLQPAVRELSLTDS